VSRSLSLNSFFPAVHGCWDTEKRHGAGRSKATPQGEFFGVRTVKLNFRFLRRKIFAARKKRRLRRRLLYSDIRGRLKRHFIIKIKKGLSRVVQPKTAVERLGRNFNVTVK